MPFSASMLHFIVELVVSARRQAPQGSGSQALHNQISSSKARGEVLFSRFRGGITNNYTQAQALIAHPQAERKKIDGEPLWRPHQLR